MNLPRPLYESWLFESTRRQSSPWKRALLERALRRDEALRCLALELAEFNAEAEAPEVRAPDLRGRLGELVRLDESPAERPLFPSAWVPAGAIAVLLVTAWVALAIKPPRAQEGESSIQSLQPTDESTLLSTLTASPVAAKPASPTAALKSVHVSTVSTVQRP